MNNSIKPLQNFNRSKSKEKKQSVYVASGVMIANIVSK